jgi:hypothetical protein
MDHVSANDAENTGVMRHCVAQLQDGMFWLVWRPGAPISVSIEVRAADLKHTTVSNYKKDVLYAFFK